MNNPETLATLTHKTHDEYKQDIKKHNTENKKDEQD